MHLQVRRRRARTRQRGRARRVLLTPRRNACSAAAAERRRAAAEAAAPPTRLDGVITEVGGEGARQANRHAQHVRDAGGQQPLAVVRRLRGAASAAARRSTPEGGCVPHACATHPDAAHEQALRHAHRLPVLLQLAHWRGVVSGAASGEAVSPGGAAARGTRFARRRTRRTAGARAHLWPALSPATRCAQPPPASAAPFAADQQAACPGSGPAAPAHARRPLSAAPVTVTLAAAGAWRCTGGGGRRRVLCKPRPKFCPCGSRAPAPTQNRQ